MPSMVIVAVKPNGRGYRFNIEIPTNFVLSGYGKGSVQNFVAKAKKKGASSTQRKIAGKKNIPSVQFADNILSSDYSSNLAKFKKIVKSNLLGQSLRIVRDEQGRLLVMYHGTNTPGFTVFNPKKSDDGISLFFTDSVDVTDSYKESDGESCFRVTHSTSASICTMRK